MTRYTPAQLGQMLADKQAQDAERWESIEETLARAPEPSPPVPDASETYPDPDISAADEVRPSYEEIHAAFERRGAIRTAARSSFISHP
jgi:hypothetical protein